MAARNSGFGNSPLWIRSSPVGVASHFNHDSFSWDIGGGYGSFHPFEGSTQRAHADSDAFVPLVNAGHENSGIPPGRSLQGTEPRLQVFHAVVGPRSRRARWRWTVLRLKHERVTRVGSDHHRSRRRGSAQRSPGARGNDAGEERSRPVRRKCCWCSGLPRTWTLIRPVLPRWSLRRRLRGRRTGGIRARPRRYSRRTRR